MKHISIVRKSALKLVLLIGSFLASGLIILAMVLGNESGNFVIQVESGDVEKSIAITDDPNDKVYTNRLEAGGFSGMTCTTPRYFLNGDDYKEQEPLLKELTTDLGRTITKETLFIYTCYIVNTSDAAMNIDIEMSLSNVTNQFDKAIRIMTYNETQEDVHIYQAVDETPREYQYYPYTPEYFVNDMTVFTQKVPLTVDVDKIKYSVLFWIEGQDPEGDERLFDGTIKLSMTLKVDM